MESIIGNSHPARLDSIDQSIIEAMQKDGREAFAQIAEKLNVSPGMIRQRCTRDGFRLAAGVLAAVIVAADSSTSRSYWLVLPSISSSARVWSAMRCMTLSSSSPARPKPSR